MGSSGEVNIKSEYRELLGEAGLIDFDSFMNFSGGEVLKEITLRTIVRFELPAVGGEVFYLKRHKINRGSTGKVKAAIGSTAPVSEARREWEAIESLKRAGVPALTSVAMGERLTPGFEESFIVTEGLVGYTQLEAMTDDLLASLTYEEVLLKRALIREVGVLVKTLHEAGFNHRDLYLTHILAKREGRGFSLKLIDLQRLEHRTHLRGRWLVKDITALNYSSPRASFTRSDRMRFYHAYSGRTRLTAEDKSFIRKVLKKTERVAAHTVKMYKKREERKKLGLLER